jgi:hypothetical protein
MLVHGSNLRQKENHRTKYMDETSRQYLIEIRTGYDAWNAANMALVGPGTNPTDNDADIVRQRVELLSEYKDFLDQQHYAERFDSRSNLHSSVLEEFMYYLFKDLVGEFGEHALIGKSHTFKDMFFVPPRYSEMLRRPHGKIEKKDHDFIIGATIQATFKASTPPEQDEERGERLTLTAEEPTDHDDVTVVGDVETHIFDIPAVAIECKTYLDKTMLEGSSRAAEEIKARNPNGIYIVVMEWIKLTDAINLRKYKVDQIYVLRQQRNTDREYRFLDGYAKNPIDPAAVWHLFNFVRNHLTADWIGGLAHGIERGWLI